MKRILLFSSVCFLCAGLVLLSSCRTLENSHYEQIVQQREQWDADMKAVFPDRAKDTFEHKERLAYYTDKGNKLGQMFTHRYLGNEHRASSRFRAAIENHTQSLQLAYEILDTLNITIALNELGTDFRRVGSFDEASPYHYRALQMAENYRGKDSILVERNMASAYNGIGSICRAMNEYEETIRVYLKALELEEKHKNYRGIAINYANIGAVYFDKGDYEKAEEYYQISLENNVKAKLPTGIALCRINIGRIYEIQGNYDQALEQFEEAYEVYAKTTDRWHWLDACFQVAETHIKKGHYEKARPYMDAGLKTAKEIHSLKHIQKAYKVFSDYNYGRGNYKQSIENMRLSQSYADTLQRNLEVDRLLESRVKYEADKYTRQIQELDERNQIQLMKRRQVMMLMIPLLIGLLGLVLLLFYKRRLDKRQAREIMNLEKVRSNFFTNITHEFRTPMTVILGMTEQLLLRSERSEDTESLKTIAKQGNSLLELVNQLLDISKVRSEVDHPDWKHGDVVAYISMVVESHRLYARQRMVDLEFVPAEVNLDMDFVPSYLKKILRNLLSNAIKFTPRGGQIYLTVAKERDCAIITVADTGEGIAEEDLPHIFDSFYQGTSGHSSMGTGVGLSLVRQMVEAMGGNINVKSDRGKGAIFSLSLPLQYGEGVLEHWLPDMTQEDTVVNNNETPQDERDGDQEMPSVLIVEDNTDVAGYIGSLLKTKYRLIFARDGREGLSKAEEWMPDIILTDLMMPQMDGYEMCRCIRKSELLNHIPVIMITAKSEDADRIQGLDVGADAYLLKPFNANELYVRIHKLLEQRRLLREKYSQALQDGDVQSLEILQTDKDFLTKLTDIIYAQISDTSLSTDKLADKICMSQSQLNRKVKSITGFNTSAYVLQIRMERARRLLGSSEIPVGEIASKCGFEDQSHFTRAFKQMFDSTPTQFRRQPKS